jgi:hypothetical protein
LWPIVTQEDWRLGTLSSTIRAKVRDRVGLLQVGKLGRPLRLQGPADERGEAAGPALDFTHPEHVLDPVRVGLAHAVHHADGGPESLTMRFLLHTQPLVRLRLLRSDTLADLVDQDLAAAAGNAVQPRRPQFADNVRHGHPETLGKEHHLRG